MECRQHALDGQVAKVEELSLGTLVDGRDSQVEAARFVAGSEDAVHI
jgi:hypothetical protein